MSAPGKFRFVSSDRRVREDRRFVVGKGNFAADIVPQGVKHVALVTCPHPAAKIVSIDKSAALAMPGVHYVLDGEELSGATNVLATGMDTPNVPRWPLAVGRARYAGEWVAAVVADSRALTEDAAEKVSVAYEPLPFNLDPERAFEPSSPPVHPEHGSNVLLHKTFVWGPVDADFAAAAAWRVTLPAGFDPAATPLLRLRYTGDVARLRVGGRLVQDDFFNGDVLEVDLLRHAAELAAGAEITVEILPLRPDAPFLLPEGTRPAVPTALLHEATLVPSLSLSF